MYHLADAEFAGGFLVAIDQFDALADATTGVAHGGDVGNNVAADFAGIRVHVPPTVMRVGFPTEGEIPARNKNRGPVVDVDAFDGRVGIGGHPIFDHPGPVADFFNFIERMKHGMIHPQSVTGAFREDIVCGLQGGLVGGRIPHQRVEDDRSAVEDVLAEDAHLWGR